MDHSHRHHEGPGWVAVLLISLVTSSAVVAGFQWASLNGHLPPVLTVPSHTAPAQAAVVAPQKPSSTKVPSLTGLPASVASELLSARGLRLVVSERREHEKLPIDAVITQEPLSDSVVPEDSPVTVSVSTGPGTGVSVPDLAGKSVEQAKAALEAAGLTMAPLAESDPKDGVVESTSPAATQSAARGSVVKLVLKSTGADVPRVVGMPFGKAKKLLEQAGFKVGKVREDVDETRDSMVVLRQAPEAGTRVPAGSSIDLVRNEEF